MANNVNAGLTSLNNSERFLGFPIEGRTDLIYVAATDIVMIDQDASSNTLTNIYYKSGVDTSTIQITHSADVSKSVPGTIWKALWDLNQRQYDVTVEVLLPRVVSAITTGCSICAEKIVSTVVTDNGPIPTSGLVLLQINGTQTFTLPSATSTGTTVSVIVDAGINTPAGTLTPYKVMGAASNILFNAVGQRVDLQYTGDNGWSLAGRSSGAAATTAVVAGLPLIV